MKGFIVATVGISFIVFLVIIFAPVQMYDTSPGPPPFPLAPGCGGINIPWSRVVGGTTDICIGLLEWAV